ncbi:Uncharacterised protein [Vibrio cholerae]|nr:Uncharacterised protein [Vibrio cholerae]CSC43889.1 Uncharacterised protein [Vibrio cholerae]
MREPEQVELGSTYCHSDNANGSYPPFLGFRFVLYRCHTASLRDRQ